MRAGYQTGGIYSGEFGAGWRQHLEIGHAEFVNHEALHRCFAVVPVNHERLIWACDRCHGGASRWREDNGTCRRCRRRWETDQRTKRSVFLQRIASRFGIANGIGGQFSAILAVRDCDWAAQR